MEEQHPAVVIEEEAEEGGSLTGKAVQADELEEEAEHIPHDHAAEDVVERQEAEACHDSQEADPLVLLGEGHVCADCAAARLAAEGQLAKHDDAAHDNDQYEIDYEEGEAARHAHLVREAPNVAQADRRADGCHQEAKVGAP